VYRFLFGCKIFLFGGTILQAHKQLQSMQRAAVAEYIDKTTAASMEECLVLHLVWNMSRDEPQEGLSWRLSSSSAPF
jgi:hypothetical protein